MARLDAFNANTQAQPPDCEFAQIKQGVRGSERHTVIAADVGGQAALFKQPLKHRESVLFVFPEFATLDLISRGRAEIVAGRGSFVESYPLFGLRLEDYDSLFEEKLDLLLKIRASTHVHWSGKHRAALTGQAIYPRPLQDPLPIWVGVGGTPESFVRAGMLGLPLMVAIIGGEPRRFRPLIDLYRGAGRRAGHSPERLTVGLHSVGFLADTTDEAAEIFFPGYAHIY
jgi:alkanesulfonate monooxygenase SsuD/methylene tetrahydromethanopterin reductase-like flavin-dependent oxidoreductase (luciferase family)